MLASGSVEPVNIAEYEELARQKLPPEAYDFIAGGAEDEVTLRANREAFEQLRLRPRVLVDVSSVDTSTQVLGQRVQFPLLLAPVALQKIAHPQGELASARAAAAGGTITLLSTLSSYSMEEVAAAANGPKWFQLYCYRDRDLTKRLVQRAEAAGYGAVCVTVDVPRLGRRERDLRHELRFPADVLPQNLVKELGLSTIPSQLQRSAQAAPWSGVSVPPGTMEIIPSLTWQDIDWLRSLTGLPLLIKGILTVEDARIAVEHGVAGIVVSNHGGRQLDGAAPAIQALPEIVESVQGRAEVLVDGGVRRGTDVLKALALGAGAVLVGRAFMWGLAAGGEEGVRRVLAMLRAELELAMALSGCTSIAEVTRKLIA